MNSDMNEFSEKLIDEIIKDDHTHELISNAIKECIEKAIMDSFSYGKLSRAISHRIEDILVPAIEQYDISKYVPKLEQVLLEIVNSTQLTDLKTILDNFKILMSDPSDSVYIGDSGHKCINLYDIFKEYVRYMEDNVDTSKLDVITDDYPHYEDFIAYCECEEPAERSCYTTRNIIFKSSKPEEYEENKEYLIELTMWEFEQKYGEWNLRFNVCPNIDSLRHLNKFESFLLALSRADVKVVYVENFEEDVSPDAEPKATFS